MFIDIDGKKINCDSAYTTYEISICASAMLDSSKHLYLTTLEKLKTCLDTLTAQDDRFRKESLKENSEQKFQYWTDYRLIKTKLQESNALFEKHAKLESEITGEFYGPGRERTIAEIMTLKQLYDDRLKDLQFTIERHCN